VSAYLCAQFEPRCGHLAVPGRQASAREGLLARTRRAHSSPSMPPGKPHVQDHHAGPLRSMAASPNSPVPAWITRKPRDGGTGRPVAILVSSSTTTMVPMSVATQPACQLAGPCANFRPRRGNLGLAVAPPSVALPLRSLRRAAASRGYAWSGCRLIWKDPRCHREAARADRRDGAGSWLTPAGARRESFTRRPEGKSGCSGDRRDQAPQPVEGPSGPRPRPPWWPRLMRPVGAACLSVLTRRRVFRWLGRRLAEARSAVDSAVLRKDFTVALPMFATPGLWR